MKIKKLKNLFLATMFFLPGQVGATVEEKITTVEMRALPGELNHDLMFDSNSPEVVQTEGILLSTFPQKCKKNPEAHLDFPLKGQFNLFAHHIAKADLNDPLSLNKTLFLGLIVFNPNSNPARLKILAAASYNSQPDAPFISLPQLCSNPDGKIYSGPGDRVTDDVLRGFRQKDFPLEIILAPHEYRMLINQSIDVHNLIPPLNGRSLLIHASTNKPIYAATLALFMPNDNANKALPELSQWIDLLNNGNLAGPREKDATSFDPSDPNIISKVAERKDFRYGRVAGVAQGTVWHAFIVDSKSCDHTLKIPEPGCAYGYGLSTVVKNTLVSDQIQSAPLLVHYPGTALAAHGNYGLTYNLILPLCNESKQDQIVDISIQTPTKANKGQLIYAVPPPERVFFRGTICIQYENDGVNHKDYFHLVEKQGEEIAPILKLKLKLHEQKKVQIDFLYPPDATPPQALVVHTQDIN